MDRVPHVYIPIRAFGDAKRRLSAVLDPSARRALATALATHTAAVTRAAGFPVTIVSSSADVVSWASGRQLRRIPEKAGAGLNGAAGVGVEHAGERSWLILHSDLPLLTPAELSNLLAEITPDRGVLAPSYDGGTSAIGGYGPFEFSYGPASAHRHMSSGIRFVSSLGFQLDIDRPQDLAAAARHPRGRWLNDVLGAGDSIDRRFPSF